MSNRLSGFATSAGTLEFATNAIKRSRIVPSHFRRYQDLTLSSLGMGTYLGSLDEAVDRSMENAVRESILSGAINIIDTAINYRFQKSERSISRALRSLAQDGLVTREQIFVSTKNGYLAPDTDYERGYSKYIADELLAKGIISTDDIIDSSHCMTLPFLKHELDRSLKNLGLETIDLLYLHNSAEAQIPVVGKDEYLHNLGKVFGFYEGERKAGRLRFYGMATWNCFRNDSEDQDHVDLEELVGLAEDAGGVEHGFRFIQFPYNLGMPEALTLRNQRLNGKDATLLEACMFYKIGAFTSVPLMQGRLLTHPNIPRVKSMTIAQSNLQFARSSGGIIAPLVGHNDAGHVRENVEIAKHEPLSYQEFKTLFSH